jgi:hypothetical protein
MEGYLGLFGAAFIAATLLPFYSELALVGLLAAGYDAWPLWFWATAGNTLGAVVNYLLGRWLMHWQDRPWFPFKRSQLGPAERWYARWGIWSLLMAWLPVGGRADLRRRTYARAVLAVLRADGGGQGRALCRRAGATCVGCRVVGYWDGDALRSWSLAGLRTRNGCR